VQEVGGLADGADVKYEAVKERSALTAIAEGTLEKMSTVSYHSIQNRRLLWLWCKPGRGDMEDSPIGIVGHMPYTEMRRLSSHSLSMVRHTTSKLAPASRIKHLASSRTPPTFSKTTSTWRAQKPGRLRAKTRSSGTPA